MTKINNREILELAEQLKKYITVNNSKVIIDDNGIAKALMNNNIAPKDIELKKVNNIFEKDI